MSLLQWYQPSGPRVATVHVGSPIVSCLTTKNIAQQCARSPLWSWWRYCRAGLARAPEQGHVYVGSTWPASRPGPVLVYLLLWLYLPVHLLRPQSSHLLQRATLLKRMRTLLLSALLLLVGGVHRSLPFSPHIQMQIQSSSLISFKYWDWNM